MSIPQTQDELIDTVLEMAQMTQNMHFHFKETMDRLRVQNPNEELVLGHDLR